MQGVNKLAKLSRIWN